MHTLTIEPMTVTLDSLVGKHVLDAADTYVQKVELWSGGPDQDACMIRFRLDGVVYLASEDPDDGYRSSLDKLIVTPSSEVTNVFPPVRVVGRKKADDADGDKHDVLELIDEVTGEIVLEVGTENNDDYYPSFVGNFQPKNMAINRRP